MEATAHPAALQWSPVLSVGDDRMDDTHTETLADPHRVRPASMSGCGSAACS